MQQASYLNLRGREGNDGMGPLHLDLYNYVLVTSVILNVLQSFSDFTYPKCSDYPLQVNEIHDFFAVH